MARDSWRYRDCVFCNVNEIRAEGGIEWMHAADSSQHMVFEPLDPVRPGHLLVVPVVHVDHAAEDPYVTAMAAGVAARVAMRYRKADIITSIGRGIRHLHWHVVPRTDGDGLRLPWTADDGEEEDMGLRKHGEGEVIPETEQQKTAAQEGSGMSEAAREELRQENSEADRPGDDD